MKKWGVLNSTRIDDKELRVDLGQGNFIFVGSSCDMWAEEIPDSWVETVIKHCEKFDNKYLFQTKNPKRFWMYWDEFLSNEKYHLATTIETNRTHSAFMGDTPTPKERAYELGGFEGDHNRILTIEPVMDFDLDEFQKLINFVDPSQINIGADSGGNNLPEPSNHKLLLLIDWLDKETDYSFKLKKNLKRLYDVSNRG
jgi:hypothetical protein